VVEEAPAEALVAAEAAAEAAGVQELSVARSRSTTATIAAT